MTADILYPEEWANVMQGSDEWKAARLGKATASRTHDIIAKTKSGWGASRTNYMAKLIVERLTGTPTVDYVNSEMQWGTDKEPEARMEYQLLTGFDVQQVGFVPHPTIPMFGCSPDGLIGDDGGVEIKCPNTATHIETLLTKIVPSKHIIQIQSNMSCTTRKWWDFVSYDPRLPERMRLFIRRVERDEHQIKYLEKCTMEFLAELTGKLVDLESLYGVTHD
jgi:hypothetical protein